jgi:hypothetical protein
MSRSSAQVPRPLFGLSRSSSRPVRQAVSTNFGESLLDDPEPIRVGFEAIKVRGGQTVLWSTLVNFGLLMKTYAAPQLETSANVLVRLRKCHAHFSDFSRRSSDYRQGNSGESYFGHY